MTQTNQNNLTANAVAVESAIGNRQSAIGNRQSAIGNRQSAIGNRQSAIGNRQSAIGNRQSAIGNRQPLLCLIFCAALLTSGSQNATAETSHSVIPAQAGINNSPVIPAKRESKPKLNLVILAPQARESNIPANLPPR